MALWAVFLATAGGAWAADQTDTTAAATEQGAGTTDGCESIAAARAQLAAVLKQLEEKTFADIGTLRTELEQIQEQALTRDQALAKAELKLNACTETQARLRQQIAALTAQRDDLARTVARLQAATADTTQETAVAPETASPTTTTPEHKEATRSVLMTAQHWAEAWSAQDVGSYLSFYDKAFQLPAGMSRKSWEAQRRSRLTAPSYIRVEMTNPQVQISDTETATISFTQRYNSDRHSDVTLKQLIFKNRSGAWRILEEHARPAP